MTDQAETSSLPPATPAPPALARTLAAIIPAAAIVLSWRRRSVDVIGLAVLVTILSGVAIALATDDARFAVLKAAPAFGLFGLACLVSLRARRPVMFFVGRHFTPGGEAAKAAWDARLAQPGFLHAMRVLTWGWGVACLAEAGVGIAAALSLPPAAALVAEPMLGIGTVAGLLIWTGIYTRRRSAGAVF